MDTMGFESILYKLSIKAIHALSGNTNDVITVEEAIEHNAYFRSILDCVQIWSVDFKREDGYCDIHFVLSPDFMKTNSKLTLAGSLDQLKWVFQIQRYDYGEDEEGNKVSEEDGINDWLIKSKIKVNYEQINISSIELRDFLIAIHSTTSD